LSVFIWKCVDPIHDFVVPKGCLTACWAIGARVD